MKDFRNLSVWNKSHQLALAVYKATVPFPREEIYGLTSQMRRCSVSISANIAEGCGRSSDADLARFLNISMGSACELEYYFLLARDLGFLETRCHDYLTDKISEVKRMLASLIRKLKADC